MAIEKAHIHDEEILTEVKPKKLHLKELHLASSLVYPREDISYALNCVTFR